MAHLDRSLPSRMNVARPAAQAPLPLTLTRLEHPLGVVELVEYDIAGPSRFEVDLDSHVLELLITEQPVARQGRFRHMGEPLQMGEVHFIPAFHRLEIDWPQAGRFRAVRCSFRDEFVQPPRVWALEELDAALDVGSAPVRRAAQSLADEVVAPGFNSSLLIDSLSVVVAVELGRYLRRRVDSAQPSQLLSTEQLARINELIGTEGRLPTAAEMAQECRVSRRHFFRLFRQTTGMSVADYATHRRIDGAKLLLRSHDLAVKQVAYRCGFQTPSAFSAAFRRTTGMTPKEYRLTVGDVAGVSAVSRSH